MPLNKECEGWHLLFKRHFKEWQITQGLDNSTHNRTRVEMAFVYEIIQETAVLLIYSSRLVSKIGVHASQRLATDNHLGSREKIPELLYYLFLSENVRKRLSFLAHMERPSAPALFVGLYFRLSCILNSVGVCLRGKWSSTRWRQGGDHWFHLFIGFQTFKVGPSKWLYRLHYLVLTKCMLTTQTSSQKMALAEKLQI